MEKSFYEKRVFERFPYKGTLSYLRMGDATNLPDISYSTAEIFDICNGGLGVRFNQSTLNEGTLLIIKIQLPNIPASIPAIGRVQWVKEIGVKNYQAGIKFVLGN